MYNSKTTETEPPSTIKVLGKPICNKWITINAMELSLMCDMGTTQQQLPLIALCRDTGKSEYGQVEIWVDRWWTGKK